jgi:hypothetical protein
MGSDEAIDRGTHGYARGGERRRHKVSLVLRERRSGFDRRLPRGRLARAEESALRFLRTHDVALLVLLLAVNAMNVLDYVATIAAFDRGATEANPLMGYLFAHSPWAAGATKFVLVATATALIWRMRRFRTAVAAGLGLTLCFGALMIYQLGGLLLTSA